MGSAGVPRKAAAARREPGLQLRDPWPGQVRQSLDWLRKNVPAAGQAIGRVEALADWLKTGGWETLNQVSKP
jgi:hypothetical protein